MEPVERTLTVLKLEAVAERSGDGIGTWVTVELDDGDRIHVRADDAPALGAKVLRSYTLVDAEPLPFGLLPDPAVGPGVSAGAWGQG